MARRKHTHDHRGNSAAESPHCEQPAASTGSFIFLGIATVYFVGFCLAIPLRHVALVGIMLPDERIAEWFGRDWTRFGMAHRLPLVAVASWILVVGTLTGRLILDALQVDRHIARLERWLFSLAVGMNVLSLLTLALGLAGQLHHRWWWYLWCAVVLGLSAWRWGRWSGMGDWQAPRVERSSVWFWLSSVLVAFILLGSFLPPWHFDVREYHLQVPKEWFQQGAVTFLPHNVYGNMPLGAETHALLSMVVMWGQDRWWWGALAGKAVMGTFAIWTALAVYAAGRRWFGENAGVLSAFVFLATPWVTMVSTSGLIDVVSACYYVLALHATLLWLTSEAEHRRWPLLALAGFLAGSAVACKYPALLFLVAPLGLICLIATVVRRSSFHWSGPLVFTLAVLAGCGLWLGKNWVLTSNPVYPLLYDWFDGATRTPEKDARWKRAHRTPVDGEGRRFTWNQLRHSAWQLAWRTDYGSPLLVPLVLWALWAERRRRVVWLLTGLLAFVVLCWWLFTHRLDRFLLPTLPWVALLAGAAAASLKGRSAERWTSGLMAAGFAFALLMNTSRAVGDNRYFVSLSDLRRDLPTERDPGYSHTHVAHRLINELVQPSYRVLAVGEAQVFDLEVPVLYNTCFDDCQLELLMKDRTRDERYAALRDRRISHVFVFWYELDRYRSPGNYGYSSFATRRLVREELVGQQQLLRPIPLPVPAENCELFEVLGWETWERDSTPRASRLGSGTQRAR